MRTNLPVTGHEIELKDDEIIVSTTNLKGQITYINQTFLNISGFTEKELLGEPHNIVRHPDMPSEAFADLWGDLKAGRPWVGFVKNRCKNGDHYWVEAHAAPMWENGAVVGYMSVRRKPSRADVEAHETAYRALREGRAKGVQVLHGAAVSSSLLARVGRRIADAPVTTKLVAGCVGAIALVLALGLPVLNTTVASALNQKGETELTTNVGMIRNLVEVRLDALESQAVQLNRAFETVFHDGLSREGSADNPVLKHGRSEVINGNFDDVDNFTKLTGAVATVFVAKGDDFLRISTSLRNDKGERAFGTLLDRAHPAYALLVAGKPYVGRAQLFGKDYYTSYRPVLDSANKVIGVTFIGMDIGAELADLKTRIKAMKVGQTGYYYVLDGNPGKNFGTLLVHPAKEGTNLLEAKDAGGREFIREMLERKQGAIRYPWMNAELGDTAPREKVVVFDTLPKSKWVVAGGTYTAEFEALSHQIDTYVAAGGVGMMLVLIALVYFLVKRIILGPIQQVMLPTFRALSSGKYDSPVAVTRNDEVGQVLQGLETMQNRLGFEVAEAKRQADEMTRVKIALDNVSTGVMIANAGRNIIYVNNSVKRILKNAEPELKKVLPTFNADDLLGQNIDQFHKNPKHQADMLATFTSTHVANLTVGTLSLRVTASPVLNDKGERLGAVAEWLDRTSEVHVEREVEALISAAGEGNFDSRLSIEGKDGFFLKLAEGLNQLSMTVSQGLNDVADVMKAVAQGDLTHTVTADYSGLFGQLKDDTNTTIERLREVVGRIKESTDLINTAAKEIAAGNTDLSSRTEEQASSLEETASSMEELNSTVKQNAENANQANQLAKDSNDTAVKSGQVVQQIVSTMTGISQSSKKIADIIGVIDGIAFQTNILALNAAVEAARAGEQGRGFAVVATEVRNLAQRSATAAREIKELIAESTGQVDAGTRLVDEAGVSMEAVVSSFRQVTGLVTDIANASREQASGIEQVTQAVGQMDEVTQQNAALVEQAAAAAESLEEQARALVQAVAMFKLDEHEKRNLPGPALRDAPLQRKIGNTAGKPLVLSSGGRKLPPAHLADESGDEWAEF